jgi:hypothetical protein
MRFTAALLPILCATSHSLAAQDSVSKLSALPGDAVNMHNVNEQENNFIVDQAIVRSSWNTPFGIAPLIKLSAQRATNPMFFTALGSAQAVSRTLKNVGSFVRPNYSLWSAPGFGVNNDPTRNDPGTLQPSAGLSGFQFGVAASEFAAGLTDPSGQDAPLGSVVGGVVNFTSTLPSRLWVTRIGGATNGPDDDCAASSFGMGVVDSDGNVHFRADGFGGTNCDGLSPLMGNNLFRVRLLARTAGLNVISSTGATDPGATAALLFNHASTFNTPNAVPAQLGTRPILFGSNFDRDYVFEQFAGSVALVNQAHFAAGVTDHRGAMSYSPFAFPTIFGPSVSGTGAIIARSGGGLNNTLAIWGLGADGGVTGKIARILPATISDPVQTWSNTVIPGTQEFDHIRSQTAFRGGSGQVSLGRDKNGNMLAAACVYYGGPVPTPSQNPNNYIAVARTDAAGTTSWSVAAWTAPGTANPGKTVFQNGTTPIGRLSGAFLAPAIGVPMIDSVGNVWFLAAVELNAAPGQLTLGLIRAVYNATNFSYTLELVLEEGDVFPGRNAGRNYQVSFIDLADADSISSGTAFSSNISAVAFKNQSVANLNVTDSATLGGLVLHATIIYDRNNDGQFVRSTGTSGDPTSPDEDYAVLLYLSGATDCDADGIPDDREIFDNPASDANGNGVLDVCEGGQGMPFCAGDGTGTPCPCGNNSPAGQNRGCLHSFGVGALLAGSGSVSLSADTLTLLGSSMPNSSALYFQGTTQQSGGAGAVFGDGKRCASGSIIRLGTATNVGGNSQYPFGGNPPVSVRGMVTVPGIRTYQIWYRNAAAFCTPSGFNLSNGLQITWTP